MQDIKVLIADDHGVMRDGLRMLIESQSDMCVVGEVGDASLVVNAAVDGDCDIVVLDLSMPGGGGLPAIGRLQENFAKARIVVLTMHEQPAYRRKALAAGARGYIVKRTAGTQLLDAIRTVHAGGEHVDPLAAVDDNEDETRTGQPVEQIASTLSRREVEVLRFVAAGHTNLETANRLGLSVKTVEGYRSRVSRKLGARGRADLVRFALSAGLLDESEN